MKLPVSIPLIIQNVRITGPKGTLGIDLILDTGAVFTVLSWSVLKVIGYDPAVTPDRQEIVTANGVIEVPKLVVYSISAGDAEAKEVEVICHDIPEMIEVSGLPGLSFLKHFKTTIDYPALSLSIS